MLTFRSDYLKAMHDQAPAMFVELRKAGQMDAHLDAKEAEARALFLTLADGLPTLPSGALSNPEDEAMIREQVYGTLITFPPPNATPEADPALPERPLPL